MTAVEQKESPGLTAGVPQGKTLVAAMELPNPQFTIDTTPEHNWLEARLDAMGIDVSRVSITEGDVWWMARRELLVMTELKNVSEALQSFSTGRIRDQMWRMYNECDVPILLLSGYLAPTEEGFCKVKAWSKGPNAGVIRVLYNAFMNYLANLNRFGIIVEVIPNKEAVPGRLHSLWRWTQKTDHQSLSPSLPRPQVVRQKDFIRLRKLMATDGIGQDLAERILLVYNNSPYDAIRDIMEADPKDLIKKFKGLGIGKKKIARMREEWK